MTGRLPEFSLREFMTYSVFFPAIASGPIDRVERFLTDLRSKAALSAHSLLAGGERIVLGIFKKFVIADTLAILALNAANASQIHSALWMWICLYAYAFRIYFDFSGYIDIALGLGRWMGFALPENFNRPYLQPNLTAFWNSWHITLAQWFRSYFFNPLTRALRSSRKLPVGAVILIGQLATMVLIGLWHGVTWNFALWGLLARRGVIRSQPVGRMEPRPRDPAGKPAGVEEGIHRAFHAGHVPLRRSGLGVVCASVGGKFREGFPPAVRNFRLSEDAHFDV